LLPSAGEKRTLRRPADEATGVYLILRDANNKKPGGRISFRPDVKQAVNLLAG
jgi:hypothetical protein